MLDGKAAKDKGESEDLPELDGFTFADWGSQRILRIKREIPGSIKFRSGDFYLLRALRTPINRVERR